MARTYLRGPLAALVLSMLLITACNKGSTPAPAPAEKPRAEGDLARTTLAPEAVKSLRIKTAPIASEKVRDHLSLTGWIMAKPGQEVVLTAPVAGYVGRPAAPASLPFPGQKVEEGQELLSMQPVLSPLEQLQLVSLQRVVQNDLAKAKESVTVADAELKRVTDLHKQGLRGTQDVEQAQARLKFAKEDQAAAEDKLKLFAAAKEGASLPTMSIKAPRSGTLVAFPVSPGQYVPAAAPLATIVDLTPAWLRVPVPEHDLPKVNAQAPITYSLEAGDLGDGWHLVFKGKPMGLVPQVDPIRHTADLYYEIDPMPGIYPRSGRDSQSKSPPKVPTVNWAKDQMLRVEIPIGQSRNELVLPYSAIVFDAHGGTWVYTDETPAKAAEHTYERRRVELGPSLGDRVVVRGNCAEGKLVVVNGAAALFSREFHFPPVKSNTSSTPVDDDD